MTVRLLQIAEIELDEAISYYNRESPGLGDAFFVETIAAIDRIRRFPNAWHPLGEELRRCQLRRFPYGLIYSADGGESWSLRLRICTGNRDIGGTV